MVPFALPAVVAALLAGFDLSRARTDAAAAAFLAGKKGTGFVVGVWAGGKPTVSGYGTVSTPTGDHVPDGDTLFEIGSVTKAFTGVLLAEAARRGEVKPGDPARDHLPADLAPPPTSSFTLEQLSTHHAGLPVQPPLIGLTARDRANPYADFDRSRLSALMASAPKGSPPGEKYRYSNLGAGLLGHALVHAAKADSYHALVTERICKPLGMRDTGEALTGAQRARFAHPRSVDGEPVSGWDFAALEACGGLRSTANDLLRFAAANLGATESALLPAMRDSRRPRRDAGGDSKVGFGWHVMPLKSGRTCVWHNGQVGGSKAMLAMVPETGTAVAVLCVGPHPGVDALALTLLDGMQTRGK